MVVILSGSIYTAASIIDASFLSMTILYLYVIASDSAATSSRSIYERRGCFVVPPRNDIMEEKCEKTIFTLMCNLNPRHGVIML